MLALSGDGGRLLVDSGASHRVLDSASGAELGRFDTPRSEPDDLFVAERDGVVVIANGQRAWFWDRDGVALPVATDTGWPYRLGVTGSRARPIAVLGPGDAFWDIRAGAPIGRLGRCPFDATAHVGGRALDRLICVGRESERGRIAIGGDDHHGDHLATLARRDAGRLRQRRLRRGVGRRRRGARVGDGRQPSTAVAR